MKRTTKQNITSALETILQFFVFAACITLIISLGIMIEEWKITTTPLILAIASLAWLLKFTAYVFLINK